MCVRSPHNPRDAYCYLLPLGTYDIKLSAELTYIDHETNWDIRYHGRLIDTYSVHHGISLLFYGNTKPFGMPKSMDGVVLSDDSVQQALGAQSLILLVDSCRYLPTKLIPRDLALAQSISSSVISHELGMFCHSYPKQLELSQNLATRPANFFSFLDWHCEIPHDQRFRVAHLS